MAAATQEQRAQHTQPQQEQQYGNNEEYITALQGWIAQLYQLQCVAMSFPYFLASLHSQASQGVPLIPPTLEHSTTSLPTPPTATRTTTTPQQQQQQQQQQRPQQQQQQQRQQIPQRGIEYKIPPVWKRLVAEVIDFALLFVIKLAVTFAAVDTFDLFSNVKKYEFENLRADFLADYHLAFQMTSEILVLELIHRVATCLFEALCLHRGSGGAGGATPGKKIIGLRVVYCEWVAPTAADQALVYPASDLGLARAILRSVMKNFLLMFLFPVCFTFISFHHNRTIYDVLAGSVVVEETPLRQRNNHNNNRN
ncbi:protein FAM8A1-like [Portunus trituberculatus]|uniref:protein FAM8A1-like n=1 Tax=Portunus trituberculatus TaxID=210409 RepID=UPI001E1D0A92|nr:protein FAM8A1-like [Portunus trituberculatus]XP_045128899.1 protein FAM8A1-like [Portunus trituberculatus]